jgi:hypothetical protein
MDLQQEKVSWGSEIVMEIWHRVDKVVDASI